MQLIIDGKSYQTRAWTGGKSHRSNKEIKKNNVFKSIRHAIFAESLNDAKGYIDTLDHVRTLWNRANADAFATLNLN